MKPFRLHRFISYTGYHFPWYITLMWLIFFSVSIWYLIRFILLAES